MAQVAADAPFSTDMPTLAEDLRSLADGIRAIPGQLGLREHSATLLWDTWSGDQPGEGTQTQHATRLLVGGQNPKVRWLSEKEVATSGLPTGTIEVGPLTPVVGVDLETLLGTAKGQGDVRHVQIIGPRLPAGARYRVSQAKADRALRVVLQLDPSGV